MLDENTGVRILCPYCKTDQECEHLLAVIDLTFNYCVAGYARERFDQFGELIEGAFRSRLRRGLRNNAPLYNTELGELWKSAMENYSLGDDTIAINRHVLSDLIVNLLKEVGGERYPGPIDDEGPSAPGMSSVIKMFYSANPPKIFDAAISRLKTLLESQD